MKKTMLAEFLREKRLMAGLTQQDVAKKLGYTSAQFISNWERGLSQPPIKTLKKIAGLYGASKQEIYEIVLKVSIEEIKSSLHRKFFNEKMPKQRSS